MLLNDTSKTLFGKKLLLLIHHHADVDAVASAIALQTVFKEASICAPGGVSSHGQNVAETNETEIIGDFRGYIVINGVNKAQKNPMEGRYTRCSKAISRGKIDDSVKSPMKNQNIQNETKGI